MKSCHYNIVFRFLCTETDVYSLAWRGRSILGKGKPSVHPRTHVRFATPPPGLISRNCSPMVTLDSAPAAAVPRLQTRCSESCDDDTPPHQNSCFVPWTVTRFVRRWSTHTRPATAWGRRGEGHAGEGRGSVGAEQKVRGKKEINNRSEEDT